MKCVTLPKALGIEVERALTPAREALRRVLARLPLLWNEKCATCEAVTPWRRDPEAVSRWMRASGWGTGRCSVDVICPACLRRDVEDGARDAASRADWLLFCASVGACADCASERGVGGHCDTHRAALQKYYTTYGVL